MRAVGRARARRWLAPPLVEFTTIWLLPAALPIDYSCLTAPIEGASQGASDERQGRQGRAQAHGAVIRSIESNRFVTGVTWVDGDPWHATWEGDEGELRHIDAHSGAVLERLQMPRGMGVSGLEWDGAGLFYCGGA